MILIGIGSNLPGPFGSSASVVDAAFAALNTAPLRLLDRSRLWRTRPVPDNGDPWFINAVVSVATDLTPSELLDHLLAIEAEFGRTRSYPNAPRTLDLDLIDYNGIVSGGVPCLPHPRMDSRAFVLKPLAEIAPEWRHPVSGASLNDMIARLPQDQLAQPVRGAPQIMGIVNVTPDSFSDGGFYLEHEAAIAHGLKLLRDGAAILDIGGESTRPGAAAIDPLMEMSRVVPVIEGLAEPARMAGATISIDTRNAATMKAALQAGATIVNDISALTHDPDSMQIVARSDCRIALMHMQGTPETMQVNPVYGDVVEDVYNFLAARIEVAVSAGIDKSRIVVDPGIGFGKTLEHNIALLQSLSRLSELAHVMIGLSRKQFIARLSQSETPAHRLGGSIAGALFASSQGASILRVHDVADTVQAIQVWQALNS